MSEIKAEPPLPPSPRPRILQVLLPVVIVLAVVVGGLQWIKSQQKKNPNAPSGQVEDQLEEGRALPDFELPTFQGETVRLSSLQKKVVLVNFWATWCEACMVELPSIVRLREAYSAKGFEVLLINVDENPQAVIPKVLNKMGIKFPVYWDEGQKLAELFGVEAIPLTVLLDENRKVLLIESGERDWYGQEIRRDLERWLSPTEGPNP